MNDLYHLLRQAQVYDLSQPYFVGMPHYPSHPPYLFGLVKKHGDLVSPGGTSSAADSIAFGGHAGTHIDALCHFSRAGKLHGGLEAELYQSSAEGIREHAIDTVAPIIRRAVFLDVARQLGQEYLPTEFAITPEHLEITAQAQGTEILPGDVVLLRTGLGRFWNDAARYITGGGGAHASSPGPELPAARWLSQRGVFAAGSDTVSFERVPSPEMPVHVHFLVESGIYILENLQLEDLSRAAAYQFLFVAEPVRIQGGTGAPLVPLAFVLTS